MDLVVQYEAVTKTKAASRTPSVVVVGGGSLQCHAHRWLIKDETEMGELEDRDVRRSRAAPTGTPFKVVKGKTTIETTEQLRIAIDRGHGGDKVDAVDPAAAPLGTDDEAGGSPNTIAQVRLAAQHEIHARPSQSEQQTTGLGHAWWLVGLIALLAVAIILIGLYTGGGV